MITALLLSLGLWATPSPVLSAEVAELKDIPRLLTEAELVQLIRQTNKSGADEKEMLDVVRCESPKTLLDGEIRYVADGQSLHIKKDGTRENSWGLAQWHVDAKNKAQNGETITKEIANDPVRSLEEMSYYFSKGWQYHWTCFSNKRSAS